MLKVTQLSGLSQDCSFSRQSALSALFFWNLIPAGSSSCSQPLRNISNYVVRVKHLFNNQTVLLLTCFIYNINNVFSQSLKNQVFKKLCKEHVYQLLLPQGRESAAMVLNDPCTCQAWHMKSFPYGTWTIGKTAKDVFGVLHVF